MAVQMKKLKILRVTTHIKGVSPLIQHCWSEKALKQMRMTPIERKKQPKLARDPEGEGEAAMYRTADGQPGIPAMAVKSALVTAAHKDLGVDKVSVRKALFLVCDDPDNVLPLVFKDYVIREDTVRVGQGTVDLRYRPEFHEWSASITWDLDASMLTADDLANLINRAGYGVGIGEWRPEKGGEFGRFTLDITIPMDIKELT